MTLTGLARSCIGESPSMQAGPRLFTTTFPRQLCRHLAASTQPASNMAQARLSRGAVTGAALLLHTLMPATFVALAARYSLALASLKLNRVKLPCTSLALRTAR